MKKMMKSVLTAGVTIFGLTAFNSVLVSAQDEKEILLYSNSLSNGRQEWIEEKAAEAGFKMSFVSGGSGDISNRLLAEKADSQADVVFGLDEISWESLVEEGLVHPYEPAWIGEIPSEVNVGEGYFTPIESEIITMYYNPEFITEDQVPATLAEFGQNADLAGKYRVPDSLGGGTPQKVMLQVFLPYTDAEGELGISEEGWQMTGDFLTNGFMPAEGDDIWQLFKDGEVPFSYHWSSGVESVEEEYGIEMQEINFEDGVVFANTQIGIIEKGEDYDYANAQAFVDWLGSTETISAWAQEFGVLPVNQAAVENANPRIQEIYNNSTPMNVDWSFVRENLSQWIEKMELDLMP